MADMPTPALFASPTQPIVMSLSASGRCSSQAVIAMQAAVPLWKVIVGFAPAKLHNRARKGPVFSYCPCCVEKIAIRSIARLERLDFRVRACATSCATSCGTSRARHVPQEHATIRTARAATHDKAKHCTTAKRKSRRRTWQGTQRRIAIRPVMEADSGIEIAAPGCRKLLGKQ